MSQKEFKAWQQQHLEEVRTKYSQESNKSNNNKDEDTSTDNTNESVKVPMHHPYEPVFSMNDSTVPNDLFGYMCRSQPAIQFVGFSDGANGITPPQYATFTNASNQIIPEGSRLEWEPTLAGGKWYPAIKAYPPGSDVGLPVPVSGLSK